MIADTNALTCTICFRAPPRYLRQCNCLYCDRCKSQARSQCPCGRGGGWLDLQGEMPEEYRYLLMDTQTAFNRLFKCLAEQMTQSLRKACSIVNLVQDFRAHYNKRLTHFMLSKVKAMQSERSYIRPASPFADQSKVFNDSFTPSRTPKEMLRPISRESYKKPFEHSGFTDFFKGGQV
mmetsp:Transcript_6489/g.11353  ORF Transcript_6489/g.11353 Transcript_6489/m.11353 type:complete len:178 (+) Transcript_6489:1876-2409(+)